MFPTPNTQPLLPLIIVTPTLSFQSSALPLTIAALPQILLCYWENHWAFEGHCDDTEDVLKIPAKQSIVQERKTQGN